MNRFLKKLLILVGDTQYFGWKHPFWFSVSPAGYKLKGEHYRLIEPLLQPGDILLQRFEGWIDKWFIPGFWNHAAIYTGNEQEQVIHAVSEGVLIEDIINFMRTDHMIVLRMKSGNAEQAIKRAQGIVGAEYDFDFNFADSKEFSCTEVVDYCYSGVFKRSKHLGRTMLTPDDIESSSEVEVIWDSRQHQAQWTEVGVQALTTGQKRFKVQMRTTN